MVQRTPDTDSPNEIAPTCEIRVVADTESPPTTIFPSVAPNGRPTTEDTAFPSSVMSSVLGGSSFEMPNVGQSFLGFELLSELGRGTAGRVYLCRQPAMADRRVVLKITKEKATEVQTLSRLKHTNIVPIYSAHEGPGFLAICMPYYGDLPFTRVLAQLRSLPTFPTTGGFFVELIRSLSEQGGAFAAKTLGKMSYVDAVMWLAARLAEGLTHAHDRGLVHCDIKPANLLLADDGQPMLLDFDVALDLQTAGMKLSKIGGTLQYMSTDQLELLLETRKAIDRRSDIYSLGLVLVELLTGRLPFEPPEDASRREIERAYAVRQQIPSLREMNPTITPTVEAIIRKCLAPKVTDRYPSAAAFVEDVQRHLSFQPLRYATVRSFRERAWKWVKRNPKLVSPTMLVAMGTIAMLGVGLVAVRHQQQSVVRANEQQRQQAIMGYRDTLPKIQAAQTALINALRQPDNRLLAEQQAWETLNDYGLREHDDWRTQPRVTYLSSAERDRLDMEIGTLLFLLSSPASSTATEAQPRAEVCLAAHTKIVRHEAKQQTTVADRPLDHLLLAIAYYASNQSALALPHAKQYCSERPASVLGWFLCGLCHLDLRQDAAAVACYSACIALQSRTPDVHYRRGLAYFHLRDFTAAKADFDLTIQFVPTHREARNYRAQTLQHLGDAAAGIRDLDYLLAQPNPPVKLYFMRARLRTILGDKERAYADEVEGMKHTPTDEASWVERGLARIALNPEGALDDFRRAEALNPRFFPALHNQAFVLTEHLHRPDEAIKVLNRVLSFYPDYSVSLADRAILLARQGQDELALRDAKRVAELDRRPSALYQMAAVYALLSRSDRSYQKTCLRLLTQAFRGGHSLDDLDSSPDFESVRQSTNYESLRHAIKTITQLTSD